MTRPDAVASPGLAATRVLWLGYLSAALAILAAGAWRDARVAWRAHAVLHVALFALCWWLPTHGRARVAWALLAAAGLPTVFSAVGWVLPALHPQPFEWTCIAIDRALFGLDPTVAVQPWLTPLLVEALQLAYASFYFLPVVLLAVLALRRQLATFDAVLAAVNGGFLLSYLGYYWFPTLPPYRFLDHGPPLRGYGLAEQIHGLLDRLEANRYDCFPSGHTMMTVATLQLAWRAARDVFWWLFPVGAALVAATLALRYHYAIDVLVGATLAPLAVRGANLVTRRCATG